MVCSFRPTKDAEKKRVKRGISVEEAKRTSNTGKKELLQPDPRYKGEKFRAEHGRIGGIFIKRKCNIICTTIYDKTITKHHL